MHWEGGSAVCRQPQSHGITHKSGWLQRSELRMANSSVSESDQVTSLKALSPERNVPIKTGDTVTSISQLPQQLFPIAIPEVSITQNSQVFRMHDGS